MHLLKDVYPHFWTKQRVRDRRVQTKAIRGDFICQSDVVRAFGSDADVEGDAEEGKGGGRPMESAEAVEGLYDTGEKIQE